MIYGLNYDKWSVAYLPNLLQDIRINRWKNIIWYGPEISSDLFQLKKKVSRKSSSGSLLFVNLQLHYFPMAPGKTYRENEKK